MICLLNFGSKEFDCIFGNKIHGIVFIRTGINPESKGNEKWSRKVRKLNLFINIPPFFGLIIIQYLKAVLLKHLP